MEKEEIEKTKEEFKKSLEVEKNNSILNSFYSDMTYVYAHVHLP